MEARKMTPFFSITVSALFVTFIFVFGNSQNSFSGGPLFGRFLSAKYLDFGRKLLIRTAHHTFPESRHPEVTVNPCYILSPEGSHKKISAHGLINVRVSSFVNVIIRIWSAAGFIDFYFYEVVTLNLTRSPNVILTT